MVKRLLRILGWSTVLGLSLLWLFGERWRPIRLSTLRLLREAGARRVLNLSALHGYIYGRWTNQYIKVLIDGLRGSPDQVGRNPLSSWLPNHYHGKVLTHDLAEAIVTLDHDIPLQDLEQIIPYPAARELVLKGPPDVAVYECGCRHASANPCQPTQVCMVVGQPFVDFVLEHNPRSSRKLTQMEALELLKGERDRGHIHTAWFKDAMLDRFYAICNCCKCCCAGIRAMAKFGMPMLLSSGYVAQVDQVVCTGCGECVDACPFGALSVDGSVVARDWDKCMGCGVCVNGCSAGAVALVRDERKGLPLDVRMLA